MSLLEVKHTLSFIRICIYSGIGIEEEEEDMSSNDTAAIEAIVSKLGLHGAIGRSVSGKAMEYLRKYNSKMGRQSGVLGNAHIAKPAVCVDLAVTSGEVLVDVAVDVKALQRSSGTTSSQYRRVRSVMMKSLDIRQKVSARDVCIQFGCLKLEPIVRETLDEFELRLEDARSSEEDRVDARAPRFVGAAFALVARAYKARFDKGKLMDSLGIQSKEFRGALERMSDVMHNVFFDDE